MGFLFFVLFEKKHVLQGLLLAFFLWFAFYVKLWAIYLIPALLIYYIVQTIKDKIGTAWSAFPASPFYSTESQVFSGR